MDNRYAIQVRDLNHWFGEGDARKQAIYNLNLDIERGKLICLMGPSGSGKTTALTLMACLRTVQDGSVKLLGRELRSISSLHQNLMRRKLGFIFQAHNLHESLNAHQNVVMALQVHGKGNSEKQTAAATHLLSLLGLAERKDYLPKNLSGGQKQRVAIARALVTNPEVVFADEPTAALDKKSGKDVVKLLKTLGKERKTTTLMVTHDNRILEFADRIITLEDGRLTAP